MNTLYFVGTTEENEPGKDSILFSSLEIAKRVASESCAKNKYSWVMEVKADSVYLYGISSKFGYQYKMNIEGYSFTVNEVC